MSQHAVSQDATVYLRHDRFDEPKESFKQIADLIEEAGLAGAGHTIGDIGCGTGEFLYYLGQRFPDAELKGWDILPAHIERGAERLPGAALHTGSALDPRLIAPDSLDVALYLGVHSLFDDIDPCFENALSWTKPGGAVYFFGVFNPYPVDVWMQFRRQGRPVDEREVAFNTFAMERVATYLNNRLGVGRHRFIPFEMPFEIEPDAEDPVRTWTFRDEAGNQHFTNGVGILQSRWILEIRP